MLNGKNKDEFMAILGGIYEKTPWVAEKLYAQFIPEWDNLATIALQMRQLVDNAGHNAQLALLQSHPELVGKLALAGKLTHESTREQAGAGLNQCTPAEFAEFQQLNAQYNEKFGFPYIIAVTGLTRADILAHFRARVHNDRETEFTTALNEVHKIALIRLKQAFPA